MPNFGVERVVGNKCMMYTSNACVSPVLAQRADGTGLGSQLPHSAFEAVFHCSCKHENTKQVALWHGVYIYII